MKEKLKQTKGITLIALIITIIILLILAVVSVRLVINEGFLFRTKEAALQHKVAEIDEAIKIKVNEEQIVRNTEKGEPLNANNTVDSNIMVWENTPYMNFIEVQLKELKSAAPTVYKGNVYNKSSGELLIGEAYWLPTDIIMPYKLPKEVASEFFPDATEQEIEAAMEQTVKESFGVESLKIDIDIGKAGSYIKMAIDGAEAPAIPFNNIFIIDKNYNIYYIDDDGNIIGANKIYKKEDVVFGKTYFNPETLTGKDKEAYDGIYEGALAFTGNESYARYLAQNDSDTTTTTNTFAIGGYMMYDVLKDDQVVVLENGTKLENLVFLMIRPDWSVEEIFDSSGENYIHYYMDSTYNMYKIDEKNKNIYDKDGNLLVQGYTEMNNHDITNEKIVTDLATGTEYKYTYMERFDKKDIVITNVPEKEVVDMKTDLADLNVFSVGQANNNQTVKKLILPETVKTLTPLALGRQMTDNTGINSVFSEIPNLEYIELSNEIKELYTRTFKDCSNLKTVIMPDNLEAIGANAFLGCSNVTLKFKDGKAPAGHPWGGTNINITNK